MKVIIASKSTPKVEGISLAFRNFFSEEDIEISTVEVESGVERQPFNERVFEGAINRYEEIIKNHVATYDYIVSCESGIIEQFGTYFNVQVVYLKHSSGKESWGMSQGFQVPKEYISKIKTTSIKKVFSELYGEDKGGISVLSNGMYSRTSLISDATQIALCGLNW